MSDQNIMEYFYFYGNQVDFYCNIVLFTVMLWSVDQSKRSNS